MGTGTIYLQHRGQQGEKCLLLSTIVPVYQLKFKLYLTCLFFRLELSIDNVKMIQGQSRRRKARDQKLQGGKFTGCIANLYTRRSGNIKKLFTLTHLHLK